LGDKYFDSRAGFNGVIKSSDKKGEVESILIGGGGTSEEKKGALRYVNWKQLKFYFDLVEGREICSDANKGRARVSNITKV